MLYLLFLSPGFLFMPVPRGGTMWGYTFRMCRGFPCRDNDASGRASAQPLCSEPFIQLRVCSLTLPNSTSFCILFWNSKVRCYTDFRTVIFRPGLHRRSLERSFSLSWCVYKSPWNSLFSPLLTGSSLWWLLIGWRLAKMFSLSHVWKEKRKRFYEGEESMWCQSPLWNRFTTIFWLLLMAVS